jgi:hypothetical protein
MNDTTERDSKAAVTDIIHRLKTDRPHQWNHKLIVTDLEQLRATVLSAEWPGRAGRTDRLMMLVALDFAQWGTRLDVKLPARTMALNTGVSPITASKSLRRLCKTEWLIRMDCIVRDWSEALTYLVSPLKLNPVPDSTHLYNLCTPPRAQPGGSNRAAALGVTVHHMAHCMFTELMARTAAGEDYETIVNDLEVKYSDRFGARLAALTPEENQDVVRTRRIGATYTDGYWARTLNLAQTELGVLLGGTAIAILFALTDEPRRERDIARAAGVSFQAAVNNLRRLKIHGLAVREQGADGKFLYRAGIPPEEYLLNPDPALLRRRKEIIEKQRSAHYRRAGMRRYGYDSRHEYATDSAGHDESRVA